MSNVNYELFNYELGTSWSIYFNKTEGYNLVTVTDKQNTLNRCI